MRREGRHEGDHIGIASNNSLWFLYCKNRTTNCSVHYFNALSPPYTLERLSKIPLPTHPIWAKGTFITQLLFLVFYSEDPTKASVQEANTGRSDT